MIEILKLAEIMAVHKLMIPATGQDNIGNYEQSRAKLEQNK